MFILKSYILEGENKATAEGDMTINGFHYKFKVKSEDGVSGNRYFSDNAT